MLRGCCIRVIIVSHQFLLPLLLLLGRPPPPPKFICCLNKQQQQRQQYRPFAHASLSHRIPYKEAFKHNFPVPHTVVRTYTFAPVAPPPACPPPRFPEGKAGFFSPGA